MVGDCVGHGLGAATVMGQLRSACRALLLQDASPGQTLAAMDRFAALVPAPSAPPCSAASSTRGPASSVQQRRPPAGHPGPSRTAGSTCSRAAARSRWPSGRRRADRGRHVLPPRSTLLLYTDGLVERRGRRSPRGSPRRGRPCRRPAGSRGRPGQPGDDRLAPPGGTKTMWPSCCTAIPRRSTVVPRRDGAARPGPRAAARLAGRCGLDAGPQDVLVAAGEACANAIEHGHRDTPARRSGCARSRPRPCG